MRWTAVLLLLLAGCAETPTETTIEGLDDVDATVADDRGGIEGVVVDPTLMPLAAARVTLEGLEQSRVTGDNGTFKLSLLEPGTYFVTVTAKGFLAKQEAVTVDAGKATQIRITLDVDASSAPYHQSVVFSGFIEASAGPLTEALWQGMETAGITPCACTFDIWFDQPPASLLVEAFWEDTVYTNNVQHTAYTAEVAGDQAISKAMSNPVHWMIPGGEVPAGDEVLISLWPDREIPTFQQEYTLVVTTFYVEAGADSWRFAVDGGRA